MHFLCLHGAIGNIDNISIQLAPLQEELETDGSAEFRYVNGPVRVLPPQGFAEYFGPGPHYRWMNDGGAGEESMLNRIRQLPVGKNPEDVMRALSSMNVDTRWENHEAVLEYLYDILEKHPEIEGLVGYSEGSAMAATLILDEDRRLEKTGRPRRIKCAVFFTGWPPLSWDEKVVLADETDLIISVPTLHVVGANDPYRYGALALYNVCDPAVATMFDTGKGHTIPRAGQVISELGDAVRELIENANAA